MQGRLSERRPLIGYDAKVMFVSNQGGVRRREGGVRRVGTGKESTKGGDGSGEEVESWVVGVVASKAVRPACAPTVVECWLRIAGVVFFGAAAVERGRLEDDGGGGKRALLGWGILHGKKEARKGRGEREDGSRGQREGRRTHGSGCRAYNLTSASPVICVMRHYTVKGLGYIS